MALGNDALSMVGAVASWVSTQLRFVGWEMKMFHQGVWEAETQWPGAAVLLQGSCGQRWLGSRLTILSLPESPLGLSLLSEPGGSV